MKIRKAICIAAALCMLWLTVAAEGYGTTVNLMQYNVRPYDWEAQVRSNGDEMTYGISALFDGNRDTTMEHVCWNDESLDDIPEITFYFNGATIKDLWIRNGYDSDDELYLQYARPYRIEVTVWIGNEEEPRGPYVFTKLSDVCDSTLVNDEWRDGYRRLSLPAQFTNVTRIGLWIKGWHKGDDASVNKYHMILSDLAFLSDSPDNLYASGAYGYYGQGTYSQAWTSTPMPVPAQTGEGYGTAHTNMANVVVRVSPDQYSMKVTSVSSAGTGVRLVTAVTGADGYRWYLALTGDGAGGYIREDSLVIETIGTVLFVSSDTWTAVTVKDNVNVRTAPDKESEKVLTIVQKGTRVEVLGSETGRDWYTWYQIVIDGKTGYIREDFLEVYDKPISAEEEGYG